MTSRARPCAPYPSVGELLIASYAASLGDNCPYESTPILSRPYTEGLISDVLFSPDRAALYARGGARNPIRMTRAAYRRLGR